MLPQTATLVMHLAIEALGARHGGASTVLTDLVSAAIRDERFSRVTVFCSPARYRAFELPQSGKLIEVECPRAHDSRILRWWWLRRGLGRELRDRNIDVLLTLSGAGIAGPGIAAVAFIQQSLPFSPEAMSLMTPVERLRLRSIYRAMRLSCLESANVVVQTHTMKETVGKAFDISPEKIHVAGSAVRESAGTVGANVELGAMRCAVSGMRLLYVGSSAKYKNLAVFGGAMRKLRQQFADVSLFLTLPDYSASEMEPGMNCLGYLRELALNEAYRLADIFVMPSLQETVGLPLLEAMSAGTPIVAADRPYAREICGDAAVFFDAHDPHDLASKISTLISDEKQRSDLARKGRIRAEGFRTAQPYERMLDIAFQSVRQDLTAAKNAGTRCERSSS